VLTRPAILSVLLTCICLFLITTSSNATSQKTGVQLMMGDFNSRTCLEAVKNIRARFPRQSRDMEFRIVTGKMPEKLNQSSAPSGNRAVTPGIGIIHIMDRRLVESLKPRLREMIRQGMRVYAVGGNYGTEDQQLGLINDETVNAYYQEGGVENMTQLVLFLLKRDCGQSVEYGKPVKVPQQGYYLRDGHRVVESYEEYRRLYRSRPGPWVGIPFFKTNLDSGETRLVDAIVDRVEKVGMNALPIFGFPSEVAVERFLMDRDGKSRVQAVIGVSLKVGMSPQRAIPILSKLGVPVIDAITLMSQSREEWEKSKVGLDIFERSSTVGLPELAGIIQPTVVASREKAMDRESGIEYVTTEPIPERIERLVNRVKAWINLQTKRNRDKNIALIYYCYPPGKQGIGAAYLNVLPDSLYEIVNRMKGEGYDTGAEELTKKRISDDVIGYGRNVANWAPAEMDRLARSGRAVLLPVETYKRWFRELPPAFRNSVIKDWGEPEKNNGMMTWRDDGGKSFLILPGVRYGNVLLMPQPAKGWAQAIQKAYHDPSIAPHHQYLAYYLWLKKGFRADAVAHIGTHGTHEWMGGKEVGFTREDPSEVLIQDLPNIYPYIVDDVGEGIQAKRRGMAVVIDYMTPPFDKAGMNRDLKELAALISDYSNAREKSPQLATAKLEEINRIVSKSGMLIDLKLKGIRTLDDVEQLDDYIKEISETTTPFGLHTFGKSPEPKYIRSTAEAIVSVEKKLSPAEREKRISALEDAIRRSGPRELDSFINALNGRYIPAGTGNDPLRNPDSLPTGKNFYSFDPARVPSPGTYATGVKLARELIENYRTRHGVYPDKLSYVLWATECIRHEGVMESQVMYLMGVRPTWDERGRVVGVESIPRAELGRPRIDVTMTPSGLYRDIFSILMDLMDRGVSVARDQNEQDNVVRTNTLTTQKMLMARGVPEEKARRMASVRIFTEPSGAYGNGLENAIVASNTWNNEKKVIDVYFRRVGYLYGQGFWSEGGKEGNEELGQLLLKNAISGSKIAIHSRSTNTIGVLDTDDFYQYLGGLAMAVRAVDGKTPEVFVSNMTNPNKPVQETLEKNMGREMRARYLNPEWIKAMAKEGYAGARFIDKVTEHLWGWQVTVPEAVDKAKWQEMYETYVQDKNGLGIKEMFRKSNNMWAYQSVVARMLETARKEYWKPDKGVVAKLAEEYARTAIEVGMACCDHTCNNPHLTKFTSSTLLSVPGLAPLNAGFVKALNAMKQVGATPSAAQPGQTGQNRGRAAGAKTNSRGASGRAPDGSGKGAKGKGAQVAGYEVQEVRSGAAAGGGASSAPIPWMFMVGFAIFVALAAWGFRKGGA
jgi:cobaltochelatase CobN